MRPHYARVLEGKHNRFWVKGPDSTIHHTVSPTFTWNWQPPGRATAFMQRKHTLLDLGEDGRRFASWSLGSYLPWEGTLAADPLTFALRRDGSQILKKHSPGCKSGKRLK